VYGALHDALSEMKRDGHTNDNAENSIVDVCLDVVDNKNIEMAAIINLCVCGGGDRQN